MINLGGATPAVTAGPTAPTADTGDGPLRREVDAVLADFLGGHLDTSADEDWRQGVELLRSFVLGTAGKRTRPTLCHLGWRACGGDGPGVVRVAAALELFHAFALIHDDVMDGSDTRRGRPTLHVDLADRHRRRGWRGDAERFGRNTAILWGDLCLVWSEQLFSSGGTADRVARVRTLFQRMRAEAVMGQYLDLRGEAAGAGLADCLRILRYKCARYTVERPLQIGAAWAGAGSAELAAFSRVGIPLGEAFQLRDDVLGVFGDDTLTGKSSLTDLRDGKATVLMALTRQAATAAQVAAIDRWHGDAHLDRAGADVLREIIVDSGSLRRVEEMIAARTEEAVAALHEASIVDDARVELIELARRLSVRSR
ncbi:polyprenyl synthetase family protein [Micromonospora sagamiensis]|uniref:Geranylgeranyl diphosphate synthase type I n=1 Tax=Micromonospora sagamiensis TaxID=47875 RepID=A0A562WN09_9ACTN|nr:polyprenyl synthetase family protein [Micromonospora sagamiensis]TWJ31542.1 geranylgeranyl diphosphate synthase type I [Micromonospora sagamiensis]BCL15405.1 geranylgeranyl pyrophosphate synthase [Micromonospora sagamiensis]